MRHGNSGRAETCHRRVNEHLTADQSGSTYGDLGTWDYAYDSSANMLSAVQATTMGQRLRVDNYHDYDTADRLLTTRYNDVQDWQIPFQQTSWYSYDDLGNRISHKYRADSAIGYAHDKANRMTTLAAVTQGYDDAGNLTLAYSADRGTSYTYRYDHHNRLTGVYDSTDTTRKAAFTWDGLGRRIEHVNDVTSSTTRYFFDGVNEIAEFDGADDRRRHYVHGVSYIDERLMMYDDVADRPYYYVVDRMFNVRSIIDRAGSIVERYAYDSYGRPRIRESCGRGDMNQDTIMTSTDTTRFALAKAASIWDPRADMDDDGDVDSADETLYDAKLPTWGGGTPTVTTAQAFSDVGNPYMFQGVPHFAIDTAANATEDKLSLNHHRERIEDCPTGRWNTRDPLDYLAKAVTLLNGPLKNALKVQVHFITASATSICSENRCRVIRQGSTTQNQILSYEDGMSLYQYLKSSPTLRFDTTGLSTACGATDCGCETENPSPVPTYADSDRARAILETWYGSGAQGCVTLLFPYGIYCTYPDCASVANATVNGHPILQHECCHACDFVDGGLCKYLAGWAADQCSSCPMNCDNRLKSADPTW